MKSNVLFKVIFLMLLAGSSVKAQVNQGLVFNNPELITASTPKVKLQSFTAQLTGSKVDLKWTTTGEMSANYFGVEKSYDGKIFSDAGIVFAYSNSTERKQYSLPDHIDATHPGVIYYRFRMVDMDGKSQYSETRSIRISKQLGNTISILTYPNPVTNELRVTLPNKWQNKKVMYELLYSNGQVAKRSETASSGETETINVSTLPSGFYIVRVNCEGETAQQKIIRTNN